MVNDCYIHLSGHFLLSIKHHLVSISLGSLLVVNTKLTIFAILAAPVGPGDYNTRGMTNKGVASAPRYSFRTASSPPRGKYC